MVYHTSLGRHCRFTPAESPQKTNKKTPVCCYIACTTYRYALYTAVPQLLLGFEGSLRPGQPPCACIRFQLIIVDYFLFSFGIQLNTSRSLILSSRGYGPSKGTHNLGARCNCFTPMAYHTRSPPLYLISVHFAS